MGSENRFVRELLPARGVVEAVPPDVVVQIAAARGKTPAQILIRWAIQRGTSAVPKSVTPERIEANFDVFEWELSDDEMAALGSIEPQERMLHGKFWIRPDGPYTSLEALWDE